MHLAVADLLIFVKWIAVANCSAGDMSMKRRHENALDDLLEQVAYEGFVSVAKWKLTSWYSQERFTIGIRRDIRERWSELSSELAWISEKELRFAEVKGQILLMHDQIFLEDVE
jgi:hypothetical protein